MLLLLWLNFKRLCKHKQSYLTITKRKQVSNMVLTVSIIVHGKLEDAIEAVWDVWLSPIVVSTIVTGVANGNWLQSLTLYCWFKVNELLFCTNFDLGLLYTIAAWYLLNFLYKTYEFALKIILFKNNNNKLINFK